MGGCDALTSAPVPRLTISTTQLGALTGALRRLVRVLRRVALVGAAGGLALGALFLDDGLTAGDVVVALLLLAPAAVVLLFAQGVRELADLPDRIRRIPGEGQERLAELSRVASGARTTRLRGLPLLLWRLRGSVGSLRDVAGVALPLRVLTPWFLGVTAAALLLCLLLAVAGIVALVVLLG